MIAFMEKVTSALHRSSVVETVGEVGGGGNGSWLHTTIVLPPSLCYHYHSATIVKDIVLPPS